MIGPEQLADAFALNLRVIKRQTAGLTNEDSLLQPPVRGNCMNWLLGHIAESRAAVLQELGAEPLVERAALARYARNEEPVTAHGEGVLTLEELLDTLER